MSPHSMCSIALLTALSYSSFVKFDFSSLKTLNFSVKGFSTSTFCTLIISFAHFILSLALFRVLLPLSSKPVDIIVSFFSLLSTAIITS